QIRNPLAAIKNAAYVIQRHSDADVVQEEVKQALQVIHDEVDGANQTIISLLDYARVRHATRQSIDVEHMLDIVIAAIELPASVTLKREVGDVPLVAVDVDQVRGAFLNLLRNALEAMPSGGVLTISARREAGFVAIAVQDSGPGVAPEVRA